MPYASLTLVRHGQSLWNKENRFTGWEDIDLSDDGVNEAIAAAGALRAGGISFDMAYTSYLRRAIRTMWVLLGEMDLMWIPQHMDWRFNERHYGALQGLNKAMTVEEYGAEQVHLWRRSYQSPPPLATHTIRVPDNRYRDVTIPAAESLFDVMKRVKIAYDEHIVLQLKKGKHILLVAHGNSLRALIKILEDIPDDEINVVEMPTGSPIYYELNADLQIVSKWPLLA